MEKDVIIQIRMDSKMKEQVEALYCCIGTSFAEAVCIFAAKSLMVNGLPFQMSAATDKPSASISDLSGL